MTATHLVTWCPAGGPWAVGRTTPPEAAAAAPRPLWRRRRRGSVLHRLALAAAR